MSTLTTDRIRDTATKLSLTHLSEVITQLVERAEDAQMGYIDFVDLLLEEELGLREGRRFRNALKLSGLPHHKTLDEFDFAFQPDLDVRKVRDLATLEFVKAKSNIVLLGPPGVGKTMLAVFQLVSRRYERCSMIMTSNKSFAEWGGVLGDEVLATVILDRLLHHCDALSINGPSYRLKDRL